MTIIDHINAEIAAARMAEAAGDGAAAFRHLERAHILGQNATVSHVRVHALMFGWGWRRRDLGEMLGQVLRIVGAATKTAMGWVPRGNSGGANVSPFQPMPIPADLEAILRQSGR